MFRVQHQRDEPAPKSRGQQVVSNQNSSLYDSWGSNHLHLEIQAHAFSLTPS